MDASYGEPEECLVKGRGELGGAYIVRLPCGPPEAYVRKELLWPHVREFADRGIAHATNMLAAMAEAGRRCELYAVHGERGRCARCTGERRPGAAGAWCGGQLCCQLCSGLAVWGPLSRGSGPTRQGLMHLLGRGCRAGAQAGGARPLLHQPCVPCGATLALQGTMPMRARWRC